MLTIIAAMPSKNDPVVTNLLAESLSPVVSAAYGFGGSAKSNTRFIPSELMTSPAGVLN